MIHSLRRIGVVLLVISILGLGASISTTHLSCAVYYGCSAAAVLSNTSGLADQPPILLAEGAAWLLSIYLLSASSLVLVVFEFIKPHFFKKAKRRRRRA
jgi:hypothetical protein